MVKNLSYPKTSPILACLTDTNKIIFWDLTTYTKIAVKILEQNGNYQLIPNMPVLVKNDGTMKLTEFKELDVIEKIELTACEFSWERKVMFLGMKGAKLGSTDLRNFNIIKQKKFEELEEITQLLLSSNHKRLIMTGANGIIM
ncbi:MAG: hypothetical protein EAZ66_07705 [Alphaproteobacteria bacterium]|nr:MAG: hypothetical protein EAZ66_07705 [Alphaproteobacteria bacterium]